jgi:hypothetical protein
MAKAKNTARTESPRVSADTLRKLDELAVGISIVRGTAKCVERALWNQAYRGDEEMSILVREHIVKELNRLHQQTKAIMIAIEGRLPYPDEET